MMLRYVHIRKYLTWFRILDTIKVCGGGLRVNFLEEPRWSRFNMLDFQSFIRHHHIWVLLLPTVYTQDVLLSCVFLPMN